MGSVQGSGHAQVRVQWELLAMRQKGTEQHSVAKSGLWGLAELGLESYT